MNPFNLPPDLPDFKAPDVVFDGPSDPIDRPITDPRILKALEEAREQYLQRVASVSDQDIAGDAPSN